MPTINFTDLEAAFDEERGPRDHYEGESFELDYYLAVQEYEADLAAAERRARETSDHTGWDNHCE